MSQDVHVPVRLDERELQRLDAVRRYDVLDTPPDGAFDRITALAARLLDAPIALVTIVDEDRIWFKSRFGVDTAETGRDPGLCASAVLHGRPWVVTDALSDPRTLANPLVAGSFGLRFYVGVPLTTSDGHHLGTLCVIDRVARPVRDADLETLTALAGVVVDELELRLAAIRAVNVETQLRRRAEAVTLVLQDALLPPKLPQMPGAEVAAVYCPAGLADIGGDFYDLFPVGDRTWGLMIGDVCGKGPRAASLGALVRYSLRAASIAESSPAAALRAVNQVMLADAEADDRFCSLVFALIDQTPDGLHVRLAVGGHPFPSVIRRDGGIESAGRAGSLIGLFPDAEFLEDEVVLRQGDTLVVFTDGVLEIRTDAGVAGRLEFDGRLASCAGLGPVAIAERLAAAINIDHDDVAIVALRAR